MHRKFGYATRESFAKMSNVDAQEITTYLGQLEFPRIYLASLQFALFKTYGIPTISGLLAATKEFSTPENASKRYTDTSLLIAEFAAHPPKDERTIKAIARMNTIHSRYQKAGKISNDDLLYTLSVFITEPIKFVKSYEWREMTEMEMCAIATFWKSIGDSMGISYEQLTQYQTGWKDGLEFYEDIKAWAGNYEVKYMVPHATNKQTADELVPLLLYFVPRPLKPIAANVVGVLMGNRLRNAMCYPTPSQTHFHTVTAAIESRRFLLRHLSLPRPYIFRVHDLPDNADPKTGRYHPRRYFVHPYYTKPGFWNRWGPGAWFVYLSGGDVPGTKGDLYVPEGYTFEEVGPKNLRGKGIKEMRAFEEKIGSERPLGCPFAISR